MRARRVLVGAGGGAADPRRYRPPPLRRTQIASRPAGRPFARPASSRWGSFPGLRGGCRGGMAVWRLGGVAALRRSISHGLTAAVLDLMVADLRGGRDCWKCGILCRAARTDSAVGCKCGQRQCRAVARGCRGREESRRKREKEEGGGRGRRKREEEGVACRRLALRCQERIRLAARR